MIYPLLRKLLFLLEPELAHRVSLTSLNLADNLGLTKFLPQPIAQPCTVMDLSFPNRVGLAAGLDKNGDYIDALAALGFGFIEIGTLTPKPQAGNPKPRMFRLPEQQALINRLGFNNKGVDYAVKRLQKIRYRGILGINIGKNAVTPLEKAVDDYKYGFRRLWPFASYITVNISSPNTAQLRELQQEEWLQPLMQALKKEQKKILDTHHKYIPLVVKISPDIDSAEIKMMADIFIANKIDGVIATNTTTTRPGFSGEGIWKQGGGMSGAPLTQLATRVTEELHQYLQDKIPIIAAGGIMSGEDAKKKFQAGAQLVQLYTGLIYQGPGLIQATCSA